MIAIASLTLYGAFVLVQTVRHRDYFLPEGQAARDEAVHADPPSFSTAMTSGGLLIVCLGAVVLLAKALSPTIEAAVSAAGAPKAVVGIIIAAIVLLPESVAALKAARYNRLQTSLNLALGSALASIGLTIPAVAMVAVATGWTLVTAVPLNDMQAATRRALGRAGLVVSLFLLAVQITSTGGIYPIQLLSTPFQTFERNIRDQLSRVLSGGGFDPARDIDAITVNRWPHGYAYEYNPLWDPDWAPGQSPCEIGRRSFGRITIANSDAAAAAYTDAAIDQAHRAVTELIASKAT